ncbi:hypothetical protein Nepgr_006317 [Nepenthes gracilis]|uniref:FAD dependent oxidoreductase domain-containing protein n=1 Tax=Nepenthes gracilis TaxID=150966 RepID=A0AAD3S4X0_NEPGR|nr:hypothetical protein Nepgr_006317 [Nepenthes gracilis]
MITAPSTSRFSGDSRCYSWIRRKLKDSSVAQGGFCRRPSSSLRPCFPRSQGAPSRCAVLGAGFAGLSVVWHLLNHSLKESNLHIDVFDEVGIGGGASGVSGGLIHPYSPKVKLLWMGAECWTECLNLLSVAEEAATSLESNNMGPSCGQNTDGHIIRRRGILRLAVSEKNLEVMQENARNCLQSCRIVTIDKTAAQNLVPNLCAPLNSAFFMPEAVSINPQRYLQALFSACQDLAGEMSTLGYQCKSLCLHKKFITSLGELAGEYDAVIICLGARVDMLPELSGKLPLRTCRGIVAHLQLPDDASEYYPEHSPSILSDAWLAVQGPQSLHLGSTWEWRSRNYSPHVSFEEASRSIQELMPKAISVYPGITKWTFAGARAGLRGMPPLTAQGSLPLLGCIDEFVSVRCDSKYWLVGGLGSRGLLYHGWLGKVTAQAVLSCNEDVIPYELSSWRKVSRS